MDATPQTIENCTKAREACAAARQDTFRWTFRLLWLGIGGLAGIVLTWTSLTSRQAYAATTQRAVIEWRVATLEAITTTTLPEISARLEDLSIRLATITTLPKEGPKQ